MAVEASLFELLGIGEGATFAELKKAYYRRAKDCHPDLFQGSRVKEEEFKQVVHAFDVLSDPIRRAEHEARLAAGRRRSDPEQAGDLGAGFFALEQVPVMDTLADDILEELVVGNEVPKGTTLQTLMLDLERTTRFMRFREAKTLFHQSQYQAALALLQEAVRECPTNIMYHYYLGYSAKRLGRYGLAARHWNRCLKIGVRRNPPQQLLMIRDRLAKLRKKHRGLLGRMANLLAPPPPTRHLDADQAMIEEVSKDMKKLLGERRRNNRKLLGE